MRVNPVFVFNLFNVEKLCSEMTLKGRSNCNKYNPGNIVEDSVKVS